MLESVMLARCPTCRNTFSTERTGPQDCPVCGKPLVVPEQAVAAQAPPPGEPPGGPLEGTPWERRGELGFFTAWARTVQLALMEPSRLFQAARPGSERAAMGFAVLTGSVFSIVSQLFQLLSLGRMQEVIERTAGENPALKQFVPLFGLLRSPAMILASIALTPLFTLLFLYLNALVTHLFAMLFGKARRGFAGTFLACAYAHAPLVFLAVPGCGGLIAIVWLLALVAIGLNVVHGLGSGRSTAVILAPYLLFCCLGCGLGILLPALKHLR